MPTRQREPVFLVLTDTGPFMVFGAYQRDPDRGGARRAAEIACAHQRTITGATVVAVDVREDLPESVSAMIAEVEFGDDGDTPVTAVEFDDLDDD